jgi:hypothetical protein
VLWIGVPSALELVKQGDQVEPNSALKKGLAALAAGPGCSSCPHKGNGLAVCRLVAC